MPYYACVGVQEAKTTKYEGKRVGGGLTNREKARFKNFAMLRKSGAVVGKVKRSLQVRNVVKLADDFSFSHMTICSGATTRRPGQAEGRYHYQPTL